MTSDQKWSWLLRIGEVETRAQAEDLQAAIEREIDDEAERRELGQELEMHVSAVEASG